MGERNLQPTDDIGKRIEEIEGMRISLQNNTEEIGNLIQNFKMKTEVVYSVTYW